MVKNRGGSRASKEARGMRMVVALVAVALIVTQSPVARAQSGAPIIRADYGPLTLCLGGYAIDVGKDEAGALLLTGQSDPSSVWLRSDVLSEARAKFDGPVPDGPAPTQKSTTRVAGLGLVLGYDYPEALDFRQGIPGEMVGSVTPAHRDYVLPALPQHARVRITSPDFNGGAGDRGLLRRFHRAKPRTQCSTHLRRDWLDVHVWARPQYGPGVACQDRLALQLRPGESVRRIWRTPKEFGWEISGVGYELVSFWRPRSEATAPQMSGSASGYALESLGAGYGRLRPRAAGLNADADSAITISWRGLDNAAVTRIVDRLQSARSAACPR